MLKILIRIRPPRSKITPLFRYIHVQSRKINRSREEAKDLILSVLRSTATKREAKQYISKYVPASLTGHDHVPRSHRLVVIKIRDVGSMDRYLDKFTTMISQAVKLGVSPVIALDADIERKEFLHDDSKPFGHYVDSILRKARALSRTFETNESLRSTVLESLLELNSNAELKFTIPEMIHEQITRDVIPVIVPLAYDCKTGKDKLISVDETVHFLVQELTRSGKCSVEKIIFIEPFGGIPSVERGGRRAAHVLVNLQQELTDIISELQNGFLDSESREVHLSNLQLMNKVLNVLPASATGLITTPQVASLPSTNRNPMIYNILTDRPVISSSLPVDLKRTPILETTIIRKGMPVTIMNSISGLDLIKEDKIGTVDLNKLTELIEDSFGRKIDMNHYLNRINGKVAGLIVAGNYEGAAIITWETAKGSLNKYAYLDKFAVRRSSQGSSGVADIVFKAMTKRLFPKEILWRSRANNPVNKWYFERSKGTARVPDTNWTLFWTGSKTREKTNLQDYVDICSSIEASFTD